MRRADLEADCAGCAALCCVATSFEASEDFAIDKPAGVACKHLQGDARCRIHADLVRRGFPGCTVYDCYGAGPRATRAFGGVAGSERQRNAVFFVLRELHELLWLTEAEKICPPDQSELRSQLATQIAALDAHASCPPATLAALDLAPQQRAGRALLLRIGNALGGRRGTRALAIVK
jgi:hypothetical protein